ncbi:HPr family phosphocarrier protein [Clostridium frigidicarnis]|uniref:HTH-type transcriptional regulatory protein TyrR n=1 Tax=Clostridium frigidicarnis TaxID=84698 RepID=A0A1I0YY82_9CLOT|nr:HPr family phosphocarrier protein [Clostridium frigidicarnis]SFB18379.1 phosphotransferase system HPr (HPr) family [Clostridium frigidicarnis]
MKTKVVVIKPQKGLHARIVAMVVHKANDINKKYNTRLSIKYKDRKSIPAVSLMPLILLKVKKGEEITVEAEGGEELKALEELYDFLNSDFHIDDEEQNQIDNIIEDNNITWEQVIKSTANGIVVVDENGTIIMTNPAGDKILNIKYDEVVGKRVLDVLPKSYIPKVLEDKRLRLGIKQLYNDKIIFVNITPIIIDGKLKGAVSVFEDISNLEKIKSELYEVKELKERLQLILENVHDGICFVNKEGYITYINKAYSNLLSEEEEHILGKNIKDLSGNDAKTSVLNNGKAIIGHVNVREDESTLIENVNPIILDGEVRGVVSVVKEFSEVQVLWQMLNELSAKADYLEEELLRTKEKGGFEKFIGKSGKTLDALALAKKAAKGNATVLIRGESGTGKEVIAEGIHFASNNAKGPFIRVNCAAIPTNLLESELFGHEKGAFTGAIKRKLGKFELAHNGTIFLDEIGEMEKSMQAKILRVLQEREFNRVGGDEVVKVNVRIIAATHRNLEDMVRAGEFREDLYYRLNVIPIYIPPLRERKQDLAFLMGHFLEKIGKDINKKINGVTNEAMEAFLNYSWPGNVRELENLLERIITLTDKDYIDYYDLPLYLKSDSKIVDNSKDKVIDKKTLKADEIITMLSEADEILTMKEYEQLIIEKALKKYGSFNAAGKALGITHKTVAAKARQYGIEKIVGWEKISR